MGGAHPAADKLAGVLETILKDVVQLNPELAIAAKMLDKILPAGKPAAPDLSSAADAGQNSQPGGAFKYDPATLRTMLESLD